MATEQTKNQTAKQTNTAPKSETKGAEKSQVASPPKGYVSVTQDVAGYFTEEHPVHVVPLGVKLFDGDPDFKPSALIFARLVDPAVVNSPDKEEKDADGKPLLIQLAAGETIGIWAKPGLRDLARWGGSRVWIAYKGTKDVGKKSPMKVFDVLAAPDARPRKLVVTEDSRDKSRHVDTVWAKAAPQRQPGDDADDDMF